MCCNFYWQSGYSGQCGCGSWSDSCGCSQNGDSCGCSRSSSGGCSRSSSSRQTQAAESFVTYRYRFVDTPMQTFFGPGYTQQDVLESIDGSLQTIARRV